MPAVSISVAVLTTDTVHHTFFVRELMAGCDVPLVVQEMRPLKPPYDTAHPFELERDEWERDEWAAGGPVSLEELAPTLVVDSVNDASALNALKSAAADLTVVFGTGIIRSEVIQGAPGMLLNLHGGDPERYRGLDTHLWAVWHRDWESLVTALHVVAPRLDTGDIVATAQLAPPHGAPLTQLRAANTEACADLVRGAVQQRAAGGSVVTRPQRSEGRYYSFMPTVLKEVCLQRWEERP